MSKKPDTKPKIKSETEKTETKILSSEDKRDRFERVAPRRVTNVGEAYRILSQVASSNYSFTEEEVNEMQVALQQAHNDCFEEFRKKTKKINTTFTFKK